MKTFKAGTKVFCDFHFGGKPKGTAIAVVEPGNGKIITAGRVKVKLSETVGAYQKGEVLTVPAWQCVPCCMEIKLKSGQFIRRVNTDFQWLQ